MPLTPAIIFQSYNVLFAEISLFYPAALCHLRINEELPAIPIRYFSGGHEIYLPDIYLVLLLIILYRFDLHFLPVRFDLKDLLGIR